MKVDIKTEELAYHFHKFEAEAFGFGYGTGESYIVPLLKQFVELCMQDGGTCDSYEIAKVMGDATTWFLINALCRVDFLEYGTSPRYCWIDHDEKTRSLANFIVHCPSDELYKITGWINDELRIMEDKYESSL